MCVFKGRPLIALELMEAPMRAPVIWRYSFNGLNGILLKEEKFTLITTRNSGASCFNLVELQNGVVGRAHANLFIAEPSM